MGFSFVTIASIFIVSCEFATSTWFHEDQIDPQPINMYPGLAKIIRSFYKKDTYRVLGNECVKKTEDTDLEEAFPRPIYYTKASFSCKTLSPFEAQIIGPQNAKTFNEVFKEYFGYLVVDGRISLDQFDEIAEENYKTPERKSQ